MEYALIGKKLGHSFSADFFNKKFSREGIPSHYSLVELSNFNELIPYLVSHQEIVGLNVTIPYKEDAYRACSLLSADAARIGAVNTIKVIRKNESEILLSGANTDAPGFAMAVQDFIIDKKRALVLGTGGASKAISYALQKMNIEVTLVSRNSKGSDIPLITYNDLTPDVMRSNDIIINTTPLGMFPNVDKCPPIPYKYITPAHYCFDAIYNPAETLFMQKCALQGASVDNGLGMLHNQALLAWDFWCQ
ncbi:MAG: shikimate dehydrogenase [Muribaculaceae bacterium]|nr:shikimate dehydrogenase [Muribaculaceae bacterium]